MSTVKNATSYSRLVDVCTGLGGNYNPGRQTLQLTAMRALLTAAQSSLQDVSQKRNALSGITNERTEVFDQLPVLTSQIVGTLLASQVSEAVLANARYFTRLINGRIKESKDRDPIPSEGVAGDEEPVRSIKQQSYSAKAHNFMQLAQLVQTIEGYETANEELQPAALLAKAEQLKALNEAWSKAKVALKHARFQRDNIFYKGDESLLANVAAVKSYMRVEFGHRSQVASELAELSFTKLKVR